jgi:hypothetical protein
VLVLVDRKFVSDDGFGEDANGMFEAQMAHGLEGGRAVG